MMQHIANLLYEAEISAKPIDSITNLLPEKSIEAAYQIQEYNTNRKLEIRKIVGYKIGLTSIAVQQQLGVSQPDFGVLFEDMLHVSGDEISISKCIQPKIEGEIAVFLKEDISTEIHTIAELCEKIEYISPCLEMVDSRIKDWKITIYDTIADNASSSKCILGTEKYDAKTFDWENCSMNLYNKNELVSEGTGSNCLQNPLFALQWLVNFLVQKNTILKKGNVILTGALGPMHNVTVGNEYNLDISGLGTLSCSITQ